MCAVAGWQGCTDLAPMSSAQLQTCGGARLQLCTNETGRQRRSNISCAIVYIRKCAQLRDCQSAIVRNFRPCRVTHARICHDVRRCSCAHWQRTAVAPARMCWSAHVLEYASAGVRPCKCAHLQGRICNHVRVCGCARSPRPLLCLRTCADVWLCTCAHLQLCSGDFGAGIHVQLCTSAILHLCAFALVRCCADADESLRSSSGQARTIAAVRARKIAREYANEANFMCNIARVHDCIIAMLHIHEMAARCSAGPAGRVGSTPMVCEAAEPGCAGCEASALRPNGPAPRAGAAHARPGVDAARPGRPPDAGGRGLPPGGATPPVLAIHGAQHRLG